MRIKGKVKVENIRYFKNDWGIISVSPVEMEEGTPILSYGGTFILKGNMVDPMIGQSYFITANEVADPKYGVQYEILSMASSIAISENSDDHSKRLYLESIFTEGQVDALYEALDDPFEILKSQDYQSLVKVKGCGIKLAHKWAEKFEDNYSLSRLYVELKEYDLTVAIMKKLLNFYHSPDLVIKKVKDNPYLLTEVGGIGFSTADAIAIKSGVSQWDERRIGAYILYKLEEFGRNGNSYISSDVLMDALVEQFTDQIPDLAVADAIHGDIQDKLWWSEDKQYIGLKKYLNLEQQICDALIRIKNADPILYCKNVEAVINKIEIEQGWEFTDQQKEAIKQINENNITIVNGGAGTGKSSIASAIVEMYPKAISAACCLSGKAAARLGEVIGTPGSTIHRLLGFNPQTGGFSYNKESKLPCDLIVIDEISMIGGSLFKCLLEAVKDGAKIVMLGDTGQLEAIGECNVAFDMIKSGVIPLTTLTKIHRQAAKSAIITESIKVRKGEQIIDRDWAGTTVRGENQDLIIKCFSDSHNTGSVVMDYFKKELEEVDYDILKLQIVTPMKSRGEASVWNINHFAQEYYNPDTGQDSIEVFYSGRGKGELRVGDKVINVRNNYRDCFTLDEYGDPELVPIFNGYIGIIESIDLLNEIMIIDFINVGNVMVPFSQANQIELAYAITVHKFQGAQTENVIVALDYSAYTLLSRELVYTALTRAQKKCILVAQNKALRFAVDMERTSIKNTHLKELLIEAEHPSEKFIF